MASRKTAGVNGTGADHRRPEQITRKSKTKFKSKSKRGSRAPRSKTSSTEPRLSAAESSRINGRKSRGPKSEAAKARSRYNALKHGMRAESILLPGEDPAEFEARRLALHTEIQPQNALEAELVDRLARESWMSNRTKNSAAARLEYRMRHEPLEKARAEQQSVTKLGQYLLKDVFRPAGILLSEREGGARHPALLVLKLEGTLTGCDWLLDHFERLKQRALIPGNWLENDGFALVRLLGKYRGELTSDDLVAMILLDSTCLAEETASQAAARRGAKANALAVAEANALAEIAANRPKPEPKPKAQTPPQPQPNGGYDFVPPTYVPPGEPIEEEEGETEDERDEIAFFSGPACQEYRTLSKQFNRTDYVLDDALKLIANRPFLGSPLPRLEKLNPRNIEHARERLTRLIDEYAKRIGQIRALHSEINAADAVRANERLAFDPSPEADKERRYVLAHDRMLNQTLATFVKVRKAANDGTIGEVYNDAGDPLDLAAITPSLGRRVGMGSDPSAAEGPIDTSPKRKRGSAMKPAVDEPIRTSPTRQRGACKTAPQQGVCEVPISIAQVVTQSLSRAIVCDDPKFFPNDPGAHIDSAQCGPTTGASSPGQPTESSRCELMNGTATADRPGSNDEEPATNDEFPAPRYRGPVTKDQLNDQGRATNDQAPMTKAEARLKRWRSLDPGVQKIIIDIQREFLTHNERPFLTPDQIREYLGFLDTHMGENWLD
jgi:hypothetical protein